MGYSEDPKMVRVDFFKPSGKWYTTEAVKWTGKTGWTSDPAKDDGSSPIAEFARSLREHLRKPETDGDPSRGDGYRLRGMTAVCLEPYHKLAYPIMVTVERAIGYIAKGDVKAILEDDHEKLIDKVMTPPVDW